MVQLHSAIFTLVIGNICLGVDIEDTLLPNNLKKTHIFDQTPKYWLDYLDSFLSQTLFNGLETNSMTSTLFISILKSLSFMSKVFFSKKDNWVTSEYFAEYLIEDLMGRISPVAIKQTFCQGEFWISYDEIPKHYFLKLDHHLRLNLSFEYIYFSAHSVDKCNFGRLEIKSDGDSASTSSFCGIHENVRYFPPSRKVTLTVHRKELEFRYLQKDTAVNTFLDSPNNTVFIPTPVKFNMSLQFSLLDSKRITSINLETSSYGLYPIASLHFFHSQAWLKIYHLRVEHTKIIGLKFPLNNLSNLRLCDGPGVKYSLMNVQSHVIIFSTFNTTMVHFNSSYFQCILHVLDNNQTNFIQFQSHPAEMHENNHRIHSSTSITYPENTSSLKEISAWILSTDIGLHLNISVEKMTSSGYDNPCCDYAGVAWYNQANTSQVFVDKQCVVKRYEERNETHEVYRNIYSQGNVLRLVIFSFRKYVSFSVTFSIMTTKCMSIRFNSCDVQEVRNGALSFPAASLPVFTLEPTDCFLPGRGPTEVIGLAISIELDSCIVLQPTYFGNRTGYCLRQLFLPVSKTTKSIYIAKKGFMRGKHTFQESVFVFVLLFFCNVSFFDRAERWILCCCQKLKDKTVL